MQDMNEMAIWPGSNNFLRAGFESISKLCLNVDIKKGHIFVDFSERYLRLFTNTDWINTLKKTSMKIIIICDSIMEPLAEYWIRRERCIYTAIYADYDVHKIVGILNESAYYTHETPSRKTNGLLLQEVIHIDLLLRGLSAQEISQVLNLSIKKIYNNKQSINRKLGKDIYKIMLSQW